MQDTFRQLQDLKKMGLIYWEIRPVKEIEAGALIEILKEQGYSKVAKILQKEMAQEIAKDEELEEMAR